MNVTMRCCSLVATAAFALPWIATNAAAVNPSRTDIAGVLHEIHRVEAVFAKLDEARAHEVVPELLAVVARSGGYAGPVLTTYAAGRSKLHARVAVIAFGELDSASATGPLRRILNEHADARCRALAALSLGRTGAADALPDMIRHLDREPRNASELELRQNLAIALGQLGDPRALTGLIRVLREDRECRSAAGVGLAGLAARLTHDDLAPLVRSRDADVRAAAALLLGSVRDPKTRTTLETMLGDRSFDVRRGAALALGDLDDRAAIPALARARSDKNPEVRQAADIATAVLDDPIPLDRKHLRDAWFFALSQPLVEHRVIGAVGKGRGPRGTAAAAGGGSAARGSSGASGRPATPLRLGGGAGGGGTMSGQGGQSSTPPPSNDPPGSQHGGSYRGPGSGGEGGGGGGSETPPGSSGEAPAGGGAPPGGDASAGGAPGAAGPAAVGRPARGAASDAPIDDRAELEREVDRLVEALQSSAWRK